MTTKTHPAWMFALVVLCAVSAGFLGQFAANKLAPRPQFAAEQFGAKAKPTASIIRVIDGDTIIVDVQLLDDVWIKNGRMRINGINAPELPTAEGKQSKQFVDEWIAQGGVTIEIKKERDKYGRLLGDLQSDRGLLSEVLLERGLAKPYKD